MIQGSPNKIHHKKEQKCGYFYIFFFLSQKYSYQANNLTTKQKMEKIVHGLYKYTILCDIIAHLHRNNLLDKLTNMFKFNSCNWCNTNEILTFLAF